MTELMLGMTRRQASILLGMELGQDKGGDS